MSRNKKQPQADSRPPVDALQYEKLALSAFHLCDRQLGTLDTLVALASTICRNPAVTSEERQRQQTMLELLVSTGEQYRQELSCDRELFQVIALDAKGVASTRITAGHAARLLQHAGHRAATQDSGANGACEQAAPAEDALSDVLNDVLSDVLNDALSDERQAGPGPGVSRH